MRRVGHSLSVSHQEPETRVASRCPNVALAEQNQVATQPVRPLRNNLAVAQGNGRVDASFQVKMDACGFAPEDLLVQVKGQNLTVTGERQQESSDPVRGSFRIQQTLHREIQLPPNLDPAAITCSLTPSGHLWVLAQNRSLPPPEAQSSRLRLPAPR
ncbi:heat shock protein beta-9 [Sigmodon hispidus]